MNLKAYKAKAPAINAELKALFARHGLDARQISASIDELAGTVSVKVKAFDADVRAADGSATTAEAEYYKKMARVGVMGLEPGWLGQTIMGGKYRVTGLVNRRSPKCVQVTRADGKVFLMDAQALRRQMVVQAGRFLDKVGMAGEAQALKIEAGQR